MVRGALATLLELEDDIEVVAQCSRGDEVVAVARAAQPDVALLDIEMPGMDGLEAAAMLHREQPACTIIILTTFGRPGYLRRAMEAGATGFVVKDGPADQLAASIRRAVGVERRPRERERDRPGKRTRGVHEDEPGDVDAVSAQNPSTCSVKAEPGHA